MISVYFTRIFEIFTLSAWFYVLPRLATPQVFYAKIRLLFFLPGCLSSRRRSSDVFWACRFSCCCSRLYHFQCKIPYAGRTLSLLLRQILLVPRLKHCLVSGFLFYASRIFPCLC